MEQDVRFTDVLKKSNVECRPGRILMNLGPDDR